MKGPAAEFSYITILCLGPDEGCGINNYSYTEENKLFLSIISKRESEREKKKI